MSVMDGDWGYHADAMDQDLMYPEMPEEYMEPGEYYGEDEYGYYYDEEDDMAVYTRIPFSDLLDQCVLPTLEQATSSLAPLLGICFAFRITYLLYGGESKEESYLHIPPRLIHIGSILVGMTATHMFFQGSMLYLVSLILLTYALLVVANRLQVVLGPLVAIVTVVYLLTCELFVVEPTEWHRIRGPEMVAAMKIISLGFDLDQNGVHELPNIIQFAGYIFHPGTVIFGPWISFQDYANLDFHAKKKMSPWWCLKLFKSYCLAMFSVTMSTCLIPWFILDSWGKWSIAYRDAMAFRFSHYFISYTSELTATMTAIGASKSNGDIKWDLSVTKPLHMEVPRSLVEVVTNWNQPMHHWLKTYVFKTAKVWGNFPAILLTYAASSLLHGLNFQLSAVLLSLGFYSYIEYVLRAKLSKVFDACIQAKRCKDCSHTYTAKHPYVILGNIGLGLLSVFHLAYLGLMFDSSEQEEQGYTMQHTLGKWAALDYASHILAAFMFIFHLLI